MVDEKDGWITFDKPMLFAYAGQGPYVARYVETCDIDYAALTIYQRPHAVSRVIAR
jgi:hypothetical protein